MGIEPGTPELQFSALTIRLLLTFTNRWFVKLYTGKHNIRSNCITTDDAFFGSKRNYFQILLVLFNYFKYKEWTPQIKNLINQHISLKIYFVSIWLFIKYHLQSYNSVTLVGTSKDRVGPRRGAQPTLWMAPDNTD